MISFQLKAIKQNKDKKKMIVVDDKHENIAEISKVTRPETERGTSFILRQNSMETHLGIKKGRLLFATYQMEMNGETWTLKDNTLHSVIYFCVDGEMKGQKIRFQENWKKEVEVKLEKEKIATIKPNLFSLEATILMNKVESQDPLLFSVTCLMFFMFKIYQDEVEVMETIVDELI